MPVATAGDPWFDGLIAFYTGKTSGQRQYFFQDILSLSKKVQSTCAYGKGDFAHIIIIRFNQPETGSEAEYHFDPRKNYMICHQATTIKNANRVSKIEVSIESFSHPVRGVYFPEKIVRVESDDGKLTNKTVSQCVNVLINTLHDDRVFQFQFAPRTSVQDTTLGIRYNTGLDGKQKTKQSRITEQSGPGETNIVTAPGRIDEEPQSSSYFFMLSSAFSLVLVSVISIYLVKRYRR